MNHLPLDKIAAPIDCNIRGIVTKSPCQSNNRKGVRRQGHRYCCRQGNSLQKNKGTLGFQLHGQGSSARSVVGDMTKSSIKLYYQPVVNNLGDMLSPRLVTAVTGRECVRAKPQQADMVAVGSLLDKAVQKRWRRSLAGRLAPLVVWGTGFLYPGSKCSPTLLCFMAVRGEHSRDRIRGLNGHCALGDPALLTGTLFPRAGTSSNRRILLVPSLVDKGNWIEAALANSDLGAAYLSATDDTDMVLQAIANANLVITSAMHAMIVAISYGVPAVWVAPDQNRFEGGAWKYYDFYSAFGMQPSPLSRDARYWANVTLDSLMETTPGFAPRPQRVAEIGDRLYGALSI